MVADRDSLGKIRGVRHCRSQRRRLHVAAFQHCGAGALHFIKRAVDVIRFEIDCAAPIEDDVRVQAEVRAEKLFRDGVINGLNLGEP